MSTLPATPGSRSRPTRRSRREMPTRLPRPRFTFRWLMAAVAVISVALGSAIAIKRRRDGFEYLYQYHIGLAGPRYRQSYNHPSLRRPTARERWHYELALKYYHAAEQPWLPVAPDPPE